MSIGKLNVGRGLLRLYLSLWLLLATGSLFGGHREVLTYLGSTYWSIEKVVQRQNEQFQKQMNDCKSKECTKLLQDQAEWPDFPESTQIVHKEEAKESVKLYAKLIVGVPAVLLLALVVIFKLLPWVVIGFKKN